MWSNPVFWGSKLFIDQSQSWSFPKIAKDLTRLSDFTQTLHGQLGLHMESVQTSHMWSNPDFWGSKIFIDQSTVVLVFQHLKSKTAKWRVFMNCFQLIWTCLSYANYPFKCSQRPYKFIQNWLRYLIFINSSHSFIKNVMFSLILSYFWCFWDSKIFIHQSQSWSFPKIAKDWLEHQILHRLYADSADSTRTPQTPCGLHVDF